MIIFGHSLILFIKTALLFFIPIISLYTQQYNFIRYDVKDGLALSQISSLNVLSDGQLVVGTFGGGLNIYNGQQYHLYNTSNGLVHNTIYSVVKQQDDIIWIGTEKGLSRLNGSAAKNYYLKDGLPSETIWTLALGKEGVLWIGTTNGLAKYERGKITVVADDHVANKHIWSLYSDAKGNLWIGMRDNLIIYNYELKKFEKRSKFENIKAIHSFVEDKEGSIWVGSDNGLFKIRGDDYQLFELDDGLSHDLIWSTFVDSENNLWVGTESGVTLFSNDEFIKIGASEGLTDYKVWALREDLEKNIWIGSDEGLFKITDMSYKIYKNFKGKPIDVWAIVEISPGKYLLGSELQGILSFKSGSFEKVKIPDFDVRGLSKLFIDRNNNYWVSSNEKIKRYADYRLYNSTIEYNDLSGPISQIMQDKNDIIRFATYYDGPLIFDGSQFKVIENSGLESSVIYYYLADSKNRTWAATSSGIRIIEDDSVYIPNKFEWMNNYSLLNMFEDSYGYIWTGSYEGGLFVFNSEDLKNPKFDTISVEHGLNNESIIGFDADADNNLWITTNVGINRLSLTDYHEKGVKSILSYNMFDGITGVECFQNAILCDSRNNMLISTIDGLVIFDPQKVKINTRKPKVRFTKIKIVDKSFNEKYIDRDEIKNLNNASLQLPYDHNNLTIHFIGICLTNPSKVEYSYSLNNKSWSEPTNESMVYLPNLAYGEYYLKVKASNNNGVWSSDYAVLNIDLIAPFWEKPFFQILIVFSLLGIVFMFYLHRFKKINRINQELEERIEERIKYEAKLKKSESELRLAKEAAEKSDKLKSEFLAQMSHEIRTPVNSILSYTSLLKENIKDKVDESLKNVFTTIQNSSHRLIKTIDSILNLSQLQTGSFEINKKRTDLCVILKEIQGEFTNLADQKNLKLLVNLNVEKCFVLIDHYTISQLLANLIDNAIKYTHRGKVEINLIEADNKVKIEISDTGIGMSEEFKKNIFNPFTQEEQGYTRKYEGSGLGLTLVQKYAAVNNAGISFTSEKNVGTTFTISIIK